MGRIDPTGEFAFRAAALPYVPAAIAAGTAGIIVVSAVVVATAVQMGIEAYANESGAGPADTVADTGQQTETASAPDASQEGTRAGHNGVEGPIHQTSRKTRGGDRGIRQEFPDGSVKDITPKRVKEFVPNKHPQAPPGTGQKVRSKDAQPGSKGTKRDPTPKELEELN